MNKRRRRIAKERRRNRRARLALVRFVRSPAGQFALFGCAAWLSSMVPMILGPNSTESDFRDWIRLLAGFGPNGVRAWAETIRRFDVELADIYVRLADVLDEAHARTLVLAANRP